MSGRPARTPGSRLARRGEEETESTRNFSRPANTPLRECWHLDRYFSTHSHTLPNCCLLILLFRLLAHPGLAPWLRVLPNHPPGQFGQVLLPHSEVFQVGQGKQLKRRKLDVITVNFFWLLTMLRVWQIIFVLYLMTSDSQFDYWCWLI